MVAQHADTFFTNHGFKYIKRLNNSLTVVFLQHIDCILSILNNTLFTYSEHII